MGGLNVSVAERVLKECHLNFCWEPCTSTLTVRSDIGLLEPCSWVSHYHDTAPQCSGLVSSHHYHAFRPCFPGWGFNMQPLGAALAFVAAAVLLMASHLVLSSCTVSTWDIAIPIFRLSPSGSVIITDLSCKIPETKAPR